MVFVTAFSYIVYIVLMFHFFTKVFGTPKLKKGIVMLLVLINSFLVYVPVYITNFKYERYFMLLYLFVLAIELFVIYKQSFIKTVSGLLCFGINFFGVKVLFIGIFSVYTGLQTSEIIQSIENRLVITAVTFLILIPHVVFSGSVLLSSIVRYVFRDKESLYLAFILLLVVFLHQFTSVSTIYVITEVSLFSGLYQLRSGSLALCSFAVIMFLMYYYSKLKEASITYERTSMKIDKENKTIKKLEAEAKTDFFTGFYVRSVVITVLENLLKSKEPFYIVYLDIDGLKIVNDTYGHEEGDWYIKAVVDKIREAFADDIVARIGGDEFLVVGSEKNPIEEKVEKCRSAIIRLKETHKKEYDTSISYGVTELKEGGHLTSDEIIDITDEKMYTFKRANNKQRKR